MTEDLDVSVAVYRQRKPEEPKLTLEERITAACEAFLNPPLKRIAITKVSGTLMRGCSWQARTTDDMIGLGEGALLAGWAWVPTITSQR